MLMVVDVEGLIGARYKRTGEQTTDRNGFGDRNLDTRLGALQRRIPKLHQGSYSLPCQRPGSGHGTHQQQA
jgi:putative transposase